MGLPIEPGEERRGVRRVLEIDQFTDISHHSKSL